MSTVGEDGTDPWTVAFALATMSRPDQLLLIASVYALGATAAIARGAPLAPARLGVGLASVLVVATSVHYANEYADVETDRRTERTPFSGGSGALPTTGLSPRLALGAAIVSALCGVGLVGVFLFTGHLPVGATVVLFAILVLGWMYSLPPMALAWNGLGEVDNAALGGVALPAFGYLVLAGRATPAAVLPFVPLGCVVFCNLLATTWPDRAADAAVGKDTLATRWSTRRLRLTYAVGLSAGAVSLVGSVVLGRLPVAVALASLAAVPFLAWGYRTYTRRRSPFPTVAGMVVLVGAQSLGWVAVVVR